MSYDIRQGDVMERLAEMPDGSVQCVVTSPPYWGLRDYGTAEWEGGDEGCDHVGMDARTVSGGDGKQYTNEGSNRVFSGDCKCGARRIDSQLGLEPTPEAYVAKMVEVFREVRRVLRDDGTCWVNLGDSYNAMQGNGWAPTGGKSPAATGLEIRKRPPGLKPKDLCGIPWRVAFALQADGWYLRSDIIWCISGGTRLYARTQKGDMPAMLKDLVRLRPETVQLWNGQRWTQVLAWNRSSSPRDEAIEIEFRNGERVGCTPGHQWPTSRGLLPANQLQVGDVIPMVDLPDPEDPVVPYSLDSKIGWLCGLYLAEGSMSGNTVQIAGHAIESEHRFNDLAKIAADFHGSAHVHTYDNKGTVNLEGPIVASVIRTYIHGDNATSKGLKTRVWQRNRMFLDALMMGYLEGDGHWNEENGRWRLGFTRNDRLADDLRTLAARLGYRIRLKATTTTGFGREWPIYRGELRKIVRAHHNAKPNGEIVGIGKSRARNFWDVTVEDEPHTFALASGILTHNSKPNPMPESVTDRPTKSHEYLFLLTKQPRYYFDQENVRENEKVPGASEREIARQVARRPIDAGRKPPEVSDSVGSWKGDGSTYKGGRNIRTVWTIPTQPYPEAHFATFPEKLVEPCVKAGCPVGGAVLDPFAGSGTVGVVACQLGRDFIGIELNPDYCRMAEERIAKALRPSTYRSDNGQDAPLFAGAT